MDVYFVLCGTCISIFRCDVVVAAAVAASFKMVCSIRYMIQDPFEMEERRNKMSCFLC
jgi:hypothetical protein